MTKLQPFDWRELKRFLMLKLSFVKTFFCSKKNCIARGHISKNVLS